jgi:hypothetical protein
VKAAPKFKAGDRVVAISNDHYASYSVVGKAGTVKRVIHHYGIDWAIHGFFDDGTGLHLYDNCLEFEAIYNSPLYQALK